MYLVGNKYFSNSEFKQLKGCSWCQLVTSVHFIWVLLCAQQNQQINSFSARNLCSYWVWLASSALQCKLVNKMYLFGTISKLTVLWFFFLFPWILVHIEQSRMLCSMRKELKRIFELSWNNLRGRTERVHVKTSLMACLPVFRFVPRKRGIASKEAWCCFK